MIEHECKRCGNCCNWHIHITPDDDLEKIKVALIKIDKLDHLHVEKTGVYIDNCPFKESKKCSIQDFKPKVCRDYPRNSGWVTCLRERNEVINPNMFKK